MLAFLAMGRCGGDPRRSLSSPGAADRARRCRRPDPAFAKNESATAQVNRVKRGDPSVHPLSGVELRALRRLEREAPKSVFVFTSERGAPFTVGGFRRMVGRLGARAGFTFMVRPHMLRHACGYKLANQGVDTRSLQHYLGHRNIQHTVKYTAMSPARFKDFWRD
jgi:integrase